MLWQNPKKKQHNGGLILAYNPSWKSQRQELETAGHTASRLRKQEIMSTEAQIAFFLLGPHCSTQHSTTHSKVGSSTWVNLIQFLTGMPGLECQVLVYNLLLNRKGRMVSMVSKKISTAPSHMPQLQSQCPASNRSMYIRSMPLSLIPPINYCILNLYT